MHVQKGDFGLGRQIRFTHFSGIRLEKGHFDRIGYKLDEKISQKKWRSFGFNEIRFLEISP